MMRAMKGERIGEFEELTLLAVMTLGEGAYGVLVQEVIERQTGREVTLGAVYAALERMERKGLLRSGWSESTGTRGGKPRRLFSVTAEGLRTVGEARRAREALWNAVPRAVRSRT
jgi:PadR family transcriptional regulator PadR